MKKWLAFLSIVLLTCCNVPHWAQQVKGTDKYNMDISKFGALSLLAVDVASNEVIVQSNPFQRMTPASLTKLFTTGAGLAILSKDYQYETKFYLSKNQDDKNVLLIVGGGDPTLGSNRFDATKAELLFEKVVKVLMLQEGVYNLDGGIIIDNSCYAGIKQPSKRMWEDMGNYYGAVPNGLTYKENAFQLSLQSPKGVGKNCSVVKTEPSVDLDFKCLVKSADNNKDSAYVYGNAYMDEWYISGTIPQNRKEFTIKGALPQPEVTFARELREYLRINGISVGDEINKQLLSNVRGEKKIIYTYYSPALNEIVSVVNKRSHNLFADHILFAIADQKQGEATWDIGVKELTGFWNSKIPEFSGLFFDGSGLSPFNAVSANDMVEVLTWMNQSEYSTAFKESLSIAGVDGTLKSILKEDEFKGKLIGKSGSMNGVLAYCGYLKTHEGNELAICIIANRFTEPFSEVRKKMEDLMKEIIRQN